MSVFTKAQRGLIAARLADVAAYSDGIFTERQWMRIYCEAMGIPVPPASNVYIDLKYSGKGREMKVLGVTTLDHARIMMPSITRAIRIESVAAPAMYVMREVLEQYREFVGGRIAAVQQTCNTDSVDLRYGVLLYRKDLQQFCYFEAPMELPDPDDYLAHWQIRKGNVRKPSKCLWVYSASTGQKDYSITTTAGIKVQKYFDVPRHAEVFDVAVAR
jgi:hypothetical protein